MNIVHLLATLFALIAVTPAITLASPIKVQHRAVPGIMIILAVVLFFLPTALVAAIGLVPVAAWISSRLGIEHAGHEPADYSAATQKAKSAAQAARERIRPARPVPVHQFAAHAFPAPEDAAELAHANAADIQDDGSPDTAEPAPSPAEVMREKLASLTQDPRLPRESSARLAGQRAGRDTSVGLRHQHASVRSFVPAL